MAKAIFRQVSLDRLESPEQLDTMLRVTKPGGWLALLVILVIFVVIGIWSIFGSIPQRVTGNGILIRRGGIYSVSSISSGQVVEIIPEIGDIIHRGQVVARISQPMSVHRIYNARGDYSDAMSFQGRLQNFYLSGNAIKLANFALMRKQYEIRVTNLKAKEAFLADQYKKMKELEKSNVVSPREIEETRLEMFKTQDDINEIKQKIADIDAKKHDIVTKTDRDMLEQSYKATKLLRELGDKEKQLGLDALVRSPFTGRVIEITAGVGQMQNAGQPIIKLEPIDEPLEVLVFVPSSKGKQVHPRMSVDVTPSIYKAQEYGSMMGLVSRVGLYPISEESMLQLLGKNVSLVKSMGKASTFVKIHANLIPDATNKSGYKWTTSTGPEMGIESGTLCRVSIVVERKRPISLLIPYMKEKLGF